MTIQDLKEKDIEFIRASYKDPKWFGNRAGLQDLLAKTYDVSMRTIRNWAKALDLVDINAVQHDNIMIYDLETSRVLADVWWTGKQYVSHDALHEEPRIISVSWKWLGRPEVHHLVWDDGDDKSLVQEFLNHYNEAIMVVGQNNDNFDNRFLNTRAAKHGFAVDTTKRSYDIMRQTKYYFRLPSYSMKYICKFLNLPEELIKGDSGGVDTWRRAQYNSDPTERAKALNELIKYNDQDIVATEAMYIRLRKYLGHVMHFGTYHGNPKWSCPNCGGTNVEWVQTYTTAAGTLKHVFKCNEDEVRYRVAHTDYNKYLLS